MAQSCRSIADRCPYDVASQTTVACPRFTPTVAFDRFEGALWSCAHAWCSIHRPDDGGPATYYLRCSLRTGDIEAERDFVVPLD